MGFASSKSFLNFVYLFIFWAENENVFERYISNDGSSTCDPNRRTTVKTIENRTYLTISRSILLLSTIKKGRRGLRNN